MFCFTIFVGPTRVLFPRRGETMVANIPLQGPESPQQEKEAGNDLLPGIQALAAGRSKTGAARKKLLAQR